MLKNTDRITRCNCSRLLLNFFEKSQLSVTTMHNICVESAWNNLYIDFNEEIYIVYLFHDFSGMALHEKEKKFLLYSKKEMKENFEQEFDLTRDRPGAVRF